MDNAQLYCCIFCVVCVNGLITHLQENEEPIRMVKLARGTKKSLRRVQKCLNEQNRLKMVMKKWATPAQFCYTQSSHIGQACISEDQEEPSMLCQCLPLSGCACVHTCTGARMRLQLLICKLLVLWLHGNPYINLKYSQLSRDRGRENSLPLSLKS